MMRTALVFLLTVAIATPVAAQDWREQLSADLVVTRDGKMVFEEYGLAKVEFEGYEPSQFQVKYYSETPARGLLSRDNFVALTSSYMTIILLESLAQAYEVDAATFLDAFDYTELQSPIGTPDLEINLFMTDEGVQFEIVNTETMQRVRHTATWEEIHQ